MERWQSHIDRQINEAQQDGRFNNLPGEGKPLRWDENPHTPDELRMAFKILKDNDLAPDWILQSREMEDRRAQLLENLLRVAHLYRLSGNHNLAAGRAWRAAQKHFREDAEQYNRQVVTYNLKIPTGVRHKLPLQIEDEISRALQ
jgi:hypothetical protein